MIRIGEVPAFVEGIKKVLPQALEEFPAAFEREIGRLITKEEAAEFVPEIRENFTGSLDEFCAMYGDKTDILYGEWEKFNALCAKNLKADIRKRNVAGTLEGIVMEGSDLVSRRCYELYYHARGGKSKNFA